MAVRDEEIVDFFAVEEGGLMMVVSDEAVETIALIAGGEIVFTVEDLLDKTTDATEETPADGPTLTAGMLTSSVLKLPVFATISTGHCTCSNSTLGLSAPINQSNLQ